MATIELDVTSPPVEFDPVGAAPTDFGHERTSTDFDPAGAAPMEFDLAGGVAEWSATEYVAVVDPTVDVYGGPYEVTPTTSAQALGTSGRLMAGDVLVAPIPSNYGLVTWNGSTLTVS